MGPKQSLEYDQLAHWLGGVVFKRWLSSCRICVWDHNIKSPLQCLVAPQLIQALEVGAGGKCR